MTPNPTPKQVTQRTCDDEGSLEGAPEGGGGEGDDAAESLCHQMRARLRSFEEYLPEA